MSWFGDNFGSPTGGKNPAKGAINELNNIPGQVKPYYDPYINAGKDTLTDLQGRYKNMLDNPGGLYDELGKGYKTSPGYEATLRQALSGANNAAAMGGSLGTPGHQQYAATAAGDVANKDFENYINHIMGLYGKGIEGEEGVNKQGFDASKGYADTLGQVGGAKAQYNYTGQAGENQQHSQNWSNLFGLLGTIGGGLLGGPAGGALGNWFGGKAGDWVNPDTGGH